MKTHCGIASGYAARLLFVVFVMVLLWFPESVYAGQGWVKKGGKIYYLQDDSTYATGLKKIGKYKYFFSKQGVRQSGIVKTRTKTYFLQKNGRLEMILEGKRYTTGTGRRISYAKGFDREMAYTAERILENITGPGMKKAAKLRRCFRYVTKAYIVKRDFSMQKGWIPLYASDVLRGSGGNCISDAAALGYLAKAIGYKKVYICLEHKKSPTHAWLEINGKIYDPVWQYYGAAYRTYKYDGKLVRAVKKIRIS